MCSMIGEKLSTVITSFDKLSHIEIIWNMSPNKISMDIGTCVQARMTEIV